MSNGFIPTSTYQMEKAVTEEVLLNFEAFFAHTKCSGNDFQWAVKSTSFLVRVIAIVEY